MYINIYIYDSIFGLSYSAGFLATWVHFLCLDWRAIFAKWRPPRQFMVPGTWAIAACCPVWTCHPVKPLANSGCDAQHGSKGGFQKWGYPNSWMVYNGKSQSKMDDLGVRRLLIETTILIHFIYIWYCYRLHITDLHNISLQTRYGKPLSLRNCYAINATYKSEDTTSPQDLRKGQILEQEKCAPSIPVVPRSKKA